jgi:hypothetical protein
MKPIIMCCLLSFIVGCFTCVIVNKNREINKSCQVTYRHGDKVNVLIGEWK